jgi:hypothetical protein
VGILELDQDIDGSWSVYAAADWTLWAIREDADATGYFRTQDHTAASLLNALVQEWDRPRPALVCVQPFPDVEAAGLLTALSRTYGHTGGFLRALELASKGPAKPWLETEDLNASDRWKLVTNRTDVLDLYPPFTAVIEDWGKFYLAVIEGASA